MSYIDSVGQLAKEIPVNKGNFLVTGATGLIGSCIIDVLLKAKKTGANINIYALGRSYEKINRRFKDDVVPVVQDITEPLDDSFKYDYIIHCASNADPKKYALNPVETITTNILGNKSVLDYCRKHTSARLVYTSTFEIYGYLQGVSKYNEKMSGVIDQNILRNMYPESKRVGELLLRSYIEEYNIDANIVRLSSVYGPTMNMADSKAHAQFIKNALNHENIILKSKGNTRRSYTYVLDAVSGIFRVMFYGEKGEIYNIANDESIASIAEVAEVCAEIAGTRVVFDLPDQIEKKGFSKPNDCILDNSKLKSIGWRGRYSLKEGLRETIFHMEEKLC